MSEYIDAKGLGCAQPVLVARKALESHDEVAIDVDAPIPVENISALAKYTGYAMEISEKPGNIYSIRLMKVSGGF